MTRDFSPAPRPFPAGRYTRTVPLRREFGLRLLSEPLPEALHVSLLRSWRRPARFDGNQAIQSLERQRPPEAILPLLSLRRLGLIAQIELEVSRRVVETPRTHIKRETRNALLSSQGVYLRCVYAALVAHLGEAGALAEFERRLRAIC